MGLRGDNRGRLIYMSRPCTSNNVEAFGSNVRLCRSNIRLSLSKSATMSNDFFAKFCPFDKVENKSNIFNLFRLCRKNRSTCSNRQCCFDIVAGVDAVLDSLGDPIRIQAREGRPRRTWVSCNTYVHALALRFYT